MTSNFSTLYNTIIFGLNFPLQWRLREPNVVDQGENKQPTCSFLSSEFLCHTWREIVQSQLCCYSMLATWRFSKQRTATMFYTSCYPELNLTMRQLKVTWRNTTNHWTFINIPAANKNTSFFKSSFSKIGIHVSPTFWTFMKIKIIPYH